MPQRQKRRLPRSWRVPLCVGVAALVGAVGPVVPTGAAAQPSSAQCDTQVNDTPSQLVAWIQNDNLWAHMRAFQAIADANPRPDGMTSRNSGEPRYKASGGSAAHLIPAAGDDVTSQPDKFL